jgi:hypothetical protein
MRRDVGRACAGTVALAALLAIPALARAQAVDDEPPPWAQDDEQPPMWTEPKLVDSSLEPPPRLWAAGLFLGYSSAGMLGLDVERAIVGPLAGALSAGLFPRAGMDTWTAHGGASLRARFFRGAPFHIAFEFGVAYGDEGRGTDDDPKYSSVLYLAGALHLEIEGNDGWFVRLALGATRAILFRDCSSDACRSNPNDPTDRGLPTVLVTVGNRF